MTIVAYVNGKRQTGSIHVNVACGQISDDSIANSAALRTQMARALINSGINGSVSSRIEHGGFIYQDETTGLIFMLDVPSPGQNLCEYPMPALVTVPGATALAHWHDHPFDPKNEQMPPGLCPHDMTGGGYFESRPTPDSDFPTDGYPAYVVDKNKLYRTHDDRRTYDTYNRVSGSCHRY